MAKRKTKSKSRKPSLRLGTGRNKKKQTLRRYSRGLLAILKVLAVICLIAVVPFGFVFLEKYVKKAVPVSKREASLELINPPVWVNEPLKEKIYIAATAGGEDLKLDTDAASSVQQNVATFFAWLDNVIVQATHNSLQISGQWRKPLALVESNFDSFYVDADLVALDFVPMPNLPIVEVTGLSKTESPRPGVVWDLDDLAAAVNILALLDRMDRLACPEKPLLYEIGRIDVRNFRGRRNKQNPHILLYTKDNTKIVWGAEIDNWQQYLEATDQQKMASLYRYYEDNGTLLGSARYFNLRVPRDDVPQPIDKY